MNEATTPYVLGSLAQATQPPTNDSCNFLRLPNEIIEDIIIFSSLQDALCLTLVNRRMLALGQSSTLWARWVTAEAQLRLCASAFQHLAYEDAEVDNSTPRMPLLRVSRASLIKALNAACPICGACLCGSRDCRELREALLYHKLRELGIPSFMCDPEMSGCDEIGGERERACCDFVNKCSPPLSQTVGLLQKRHQISDHTIYIELLEDYFRRSIEKWPGLPSWLVPEPDEMLLKDRAERYTLGLLQQVLLRPDLADPEVIPSFCDCSLPHTKALILDNEASL